LNSKVLDKIKNNLFRFFNPVVCHIQKPVQSNTALKT